MAGDERTVLVTGATGFLGRHTVRALRDAGYRVRALCRSDAPDLEAEGAQVHKGDVLDEDSLKRALDGVGVLIHGAGFVSRDEKDRARMMQVHVAGTRHVVSTAATAGVARIIHLSTSGTVAVGSDKKMVYHEDDPVPLEVIHRWSYYLSKYLGERAAHDALRLAKKANADLQTELVTLNPTLALGPGDTRGSSTLDVRRFLEREIPVTPSGGLSFVDVRDIADAVVASIDRGQDGERYLLSAVNLTFADFFERLSEVSGVPGPMVPIALPRRLTKLGVGLLDAVAGAMGADSPVSPTEADMASHYWYCDARKANEHLGFAPRDPMQTLLDTVRDIRGEAVEPRAVGGRTASTGRLQAP